MRKGTAAPHRTKKLPEKRPVRRNRTGSSSGRKCFKAENGTGNSSAAGRRMTKQTKKTTQSKTYGKFSFHNRCLLRLHFDLGLPLFPFCYEDYIQELPSWYDSRPVCFCMLITVSAGEFLCRTGGQEFLITPGKLLFVPEFQDYYYENEEPYHANILEIKGCHLTSILSSLKLEKAFLMDMDETFMLRMRQIGERTDTADRTEFLRLMELTYGIVAELALKKQQKQTDSHTPLARILEFLESDLERKITIAELMRHTGLSKSAITALMRKHLDITPMRYRMNRKMERAIYLLQTGLSIKEISQRLGYSNQFHFSSDFRKFTCSAPRDYRAFQRHLGNWK